MAEIKTFIAGTSVYDSISEEYAVVDEVLESGNYMLRYDDGSKGQRSPQNVTRSRYDAISDDEIHSEEASVISIGTHIITLDDSGEPISGNVVSADTEGSTHLPIAGRVFITADATDASGGTESAQAAFVESDVLAYIRENAPVSITRFYHQFGSKGDAIIESLVERGIVWNNDTGWTTEYVLAQQPAAAPTTEGGVAVDEEPKFKILQRTYIVIDECVAEGVITERNEADEYMFEWFDASKDAHSKTWVSSEDVYVTKREAEMALANEDLGIKSHQQQAEIAATREQLAACVAALEEISDNMRNIDLAVMELSDLANTTALKLSAKSAFDAINRVYELTALNASANPRTEGA